MGRCWRLAALVYVFVLIGALSAILPVAIASASSLRPEIPAKLLIPEIPAKLLILERRMRSLAINSERYAIKSFVHGPGVSSKHPFGGPLRQRPHGGRSTHGAQRVGTALLLSGIVEVSESPFLAVAKFREPSEPESEIRQIGRESFYRSPEVAKFDGGRPWVERRLTDLRMGIEGLDHAGKARRSQVGDLITYIADAISVAEIGPVVVLGHRTTEFSLSLCAPLGPGRFSKTVRLKPGKSFGCTKRMVHVFFEADGLPVQVERVFPLGLGSGRDVIDKTDILATEIHVAVQAPPASETIGEEELVDMERSRGSRFSER